MLKHGIQHTMTDITMANSMPGEYPSDNACLLDAQMFPHIFDSILRYAPPASLLVLRATSHANRLEVEKLLFEHIEVYTTPTKPYYAVQWKDAPLGPTSELATEIKDNDGRGIDLYTTRVVDLAVVNPGIVLNLFTALPMVEMVRISLPPRHESYAPVRIFLKGVTRLTAIRTKAIICFSYQTPLHDDLYYGYLGIVPPRPLDRDVKRVVMTSLYDVTQSWLARSQPSAMARPLPQGVEEVVHIFQPLSIPANGSDLISEESQTTRTPPFGMLYVVIKGVAHELAHSSQTLVGVPELHPNWLNLPFDTTHTAQNYETEKRQFVTAAVRRAIRGEYAALHVWSSDEEVDAAMERVGIWTLEEYRAAVGPRQFDLETKEPSRYDRSSIWV